MSLEDTCADLREEVEQLREALAFVRERAELAADLPSNWNVVRVLGRPTGRLDRAMSPEASMIRFQNESLQTVAAAAREALGDAPW